MPVPTQRTFLEPGVIQGDWWHPLGGGRIQCDLCPRECKLSDGQRGFCFVRQARGQAVALTSYGRASGFCIDPIEKKPLNHFYPGTTVLSFGAAGCNLGCRFCQNWDISKARQPDRLQDWAEPDDIADAALARNCRSLAFTYNDPVIFAEFAIDCARAARSRGVKTVAVSAGYMNPPARRDFYPHIDAANIDLKAFTQQFYGKICFGALQPVLDTLIWLKRETEVWLEITTLLIPGQNDSADEVARLADWCVRELGADVPLHFTAFHPDYRMLDLPRTPTATLLRARQQALQAGLRFVYVGNVHSSEAQSTRCPGCQELLIERTGYDLGARRLDAQGRCARCHLQIPGRYDP